MNSPPIISEDQIQRGIDAITRAMQADAEQINRRGYQAADRDFIRTLVVEVLLAAIKKPD